MAQNNQTSNEVSKSHPRPPPPPPPPNQRKIHKVPKLLLKEKRNKDNYTPKVVSIGPYHHGKPELQLAESFKPMALKMVVPEKEDLYHGMIKKEIIKIRNCYEQYCTDSYTNDELAHMMLLDACFIIIHMEASCMNGHPQSEREIMLARYVGFLVQTLGMLGASIVPRDMFLLENQIPLWIVKRLLKSRYEGNQSEELLNRYMTRSLFGEFRPSRDVPSGKSKELHLLEAFHRLVVFGFTDQSKKTCLNRAKEKGVGDPKTCLESSASHQGKSRFRSCMNCLTSICYCRAKEKTVADPNYNDLESGVPFQGKSRFRSWMHDLTTKDHGKLLKNGNEGDRAKEDLKKYVHSFRSVTDLKANGIHFKPCQTLSLKDVKFKSNWIYARLQLPIWCVSTYTKVFFLNMIAYELSPNNLNEFAVTAYINLMKSLIVRLEDVKELREKKILFCSLGSDRQILKLYQDINTYGADNPLIFQDVKDKIEVHYNSRVKTWIAEFIHTHFRSPWSFITLFAASCILVLTILQTVYTMNS